MINLAKMLGAPTPCRLWQECRHPTPESGEPRQPALFTLICVTLAAYQYAAIAVVGLALQVDTWLDAGPWSSKLLAIASPAPL